MKTEPVTFNRIAAQGDLLLIRVSDDTTPPSGMILAECEGGKHILAHSETGHHHTVVAEAVKVYRDPKDEFKAWMEVLMPTTVEHERSFDTHAPLGLPVGKYEIRRQREYVPGGYRRAAD